MTPNTAPDPVAEAERRLVRSADFWTFVVAVFALVAYLCGGAW